MRELSHESQQFRPLVALILILSLIFLFSAIFSLAGAYLAVWIFGIESIQTFTASFENQLQYPEAMIFLQGFTAFGTFILPAIVYARITQSRVLPFFTLDRPVSKLLLFLAVATLISGQGLVTFSAWLNQQIAFPDWTGSLGRSLNEMNEKVDRGYRIFLDIHSFGRLMVMLLVAGILPAFGEEFLFRGIVQRIFQHWTRHGHLAVWLAAIIFSLIHMQFLNFLPRLVLGAMLGYLFLWSGNLWYSIAAHFFNNAALLVYAYFYVMQGGDPAELQSNADFQWLPVIFSSLLSLFLLYLFKRKAQIPDTDGT